ncbi:MAG: hypothetical protein H6R10_2236 [Rhodocyclaceae bacterium]|nr:hypothetical protein [Rhodocyclaceae bacterium]
MQPEGGAFMEPGEDCLRSRSDRVPQPGGINVPPDALRYVKECVEHV